MDLGSNIVLHYCIPPGGRNKARREFDLNLGEIKFYYYIIRFYENSD